MEFQELSKEERDWIDAYLDGTIELDDFDVLQERLLQSSILRAKFRQYVALDHTLKAKLGESDSAAASWLNSTDEPESEKRTILTFPSIIPMASAAAIAFLLGLGLMRLNSPSAVEPDRAVAIEQPSAKGFAVLGQLFDVVWSEGTFAHREGDSLGAEVLRIVSGTAEVQFYSGALMTIEGPAEISLTSAWEASCSEGAVRMKVPPAAHGFKLHAPSTEIVDLGTEFGLVVRDGSGQVEVFDGEIAVKHRGGNEQLLQKGMAAGLSKDGPLASIESDQSLFPDVGQFLSRSKEQKLSDYARWEAHRDTLAKDQRLIAYYDFARESSTSLLPNLTIPLNPDLDGAVILAGPVAGRWPAMKSALEFGRPGSRVRVNIPGEFSALTFVCWARIDSLDRNYNALFMGDGYETGEPHWQIKNDGRLMLSVMVDDTHRNPKYKQYEGLHRVYFSEPFWDLSMSGQWLHLASVFDPANRAVSHYVNGKRISSQVIEDKYLIETLRIGNGEIGNWGLPFREDPTFAIRNLNGRMDELAIFDTTLSDAEVETLWRRSRKGS